MAELRAHSKAVLSGKAGREPISLVPFTPREFANRQKDRKYHMLFYLLRVATRVARTRHATRVARTRKTVRETRLR
jgi:hypothetical protein